MGDGGIKKKIERRKKEQRQRETTQKEKKKEIKDRKGRSREKLVAPLPQVSTCLSWAT